MGGEGSWRTGWDTMDGQFVLKLKGRLPDYGGAAHSTMGGNDYDWDKGLFSYNVEFSKVLFSHVSEVESVIFGDTEFPLDGLEAHSGRRGRTPNPLLCSPLSV